ILPILKRTDKVIRKADEESAAPTAGFDLGLKPQIQGIMQVEVGQDRRHDPTLRCARGRMDHLSVRVQDTCLEPFLNQAQKRLVINTLSEHPKHPIMIDVVEESLDVRFHNPTVPPILQLIREVPYRIKRATTRTIPIAAIEKVLLINGLQDLGYRKLQ